MPNPVAGVIGGVSLVGGALQSRSNSRAVNAQVSADQAAINEQRRQFDTFQRLLQPYVNAGTPALQGLLNLAGLGGQTVDWAGYARSNPQLMAAYEAQRGRVPSGPVPPGGVGAPYGLGDTPGFAPQSFPQANGLVGDVFNRAIQVAGPLREDFYTTGEGGGLRSDITSFNRAQPLSLEQFAQQYYQQNGGDISQFQQNPQAQAIAQLEQQPLFQSLFRQGEDAILQNASATGGIRGGNTKGALARFRPQLLNQFFNEQYARLAGIAELGQNAAAGVGSAGLATGANIGNLLSSQGAARAQGAINQGNIFGNILGGVGGALTGGFTGGLGRLNNDALQTIARNPGIF